MEPLIAEQDQVRQPADTELAQQLTELVASYGLDPELAALFSTESDGLYQYEGMGTDYRDHLAELRRESAADLKEAFDYIYGRNVIDEAIDGAPREARRHIRSTDFSRRMGATVMETVLSHPDGRDWAQDIKDAKHQGLGASELVRAIVASNNLQYALEVDYQVGPLTSEDREVISRVTGLDPADFGRDATMRDVATQLQEKGLLDTSKEALDARVEKFAAASQVEAAKLFLIGLSDVSILKAGSPVKQARWLAAQYKDTLLMDDYDLKIEMMNSMGRMYRDFALREHHGATRDLLHARSKWAFTTARDLDESLNNFGEVYEALGYELHPLLQSEEESASATIHYLPKPKHGTADGQSEERSALHDEFESELQRLHDRAAELRKTWRMGGHERRDRGFSTMYRELVGGFRNFAGVQLLDRLSKQDAQAYIDIAAHLDELASDPEAREQLENGLNEQSAIQDDLELLQIYAKELGVRITRPNITPVHEVTSEITRNWGTFRQVALKTWPGQEGVQVIQRLERLLFNEPQPAVDDEITQEAVREQLEMAEYLDKIVLPPDATMQDVQHALDRLGEGRTLSIFEWKRLKDLVKLREDFGGTLYRTKDFKKEEEQGTELLNDDELQFEPDQSTEQKAKKKKTRAIEDDPSFWILTFEFEGDRFIIAESAFTNHATFVINDRLIEGSCLQVLGVGRRQAPNHGAHPVIHSANAKLSHEERLRNKVLELHGTAA